MDRALIKTQETRLFDSRMLPFADLLQLLANHAADVLRSSSPQFRALLTGGAWSSYTNGLTGELEKLAAQCLQWYWLKRSPVGFEAGSAMKRQDYHTFVQQLKACHGRTLRKEYPILEGVLSTAIWNWIQMSRELGYRLMQDLPKLDPVTNPKTECRIGDIARTSADCHNDGRSTLIITFTSGQRMVYKPRSLAMAACFNRFLAWTNLLVSDNRLATLKIINRRQYGWMEYVAYRPCYNEKQVRHFYWNTGRLLKVLDLLNARDCHLENIIASGENPLLVDHEMLIQPELLTGDVAELSVTDRLMRLGYLPHIQHRYGCSYDLSGLGGIGGDAMPYKVLRWQQVNTDQMTAEWRPAITPEEQNLPRLNGRRIAPFNYLPEISSGYAEMHELLVHHKEKLLATGSPLTHLNRQPIRFVFRPTRAYKGLLKRLLAPATLENRQRYDAELKRLEPILQSGRGSGYHGLVEAEKQALGRLDIPRFSTTVNSRHIFSNNRIVVPDAFAGSGLEALHLRIEDLSGASLPRELAVIQSSIQQAGEWREHNQPHQLIQGECHV